MCNQRTYNGSLATEKLKRCNNIFLYVHIAFLQGFLVLAAQLMFVFPPPIPLLLVSSFV